MFTFEYHGNSRRQGAWTCHRYIYTSYNPRDCINTIEWKSSTTADGAGYQACYVGEEEVQKLGVDACKCSLMPMLYSLMSQP